MPGFRALVAVAVVLAGMAGAGAARAADGKGTLARVLDRGQLVCGVMKNLDTSRTGPWAFYAQFCRAVAAAVLGDGDAVDYRELEIGHWFSAVRDHDVDLLAAPANQTLRRESTLGIDAAGVVYYGTQAVIAYRDLGLRSLKDAGGKAICVQEGSTSAETLADFMAREKVALTVRPFRSGEGRWNALLLRNCEMMIVDHQLLVAGRAERPGLMERTVILPDRFGLEPQGPVVAADDPQWRHIVAWIINAMVLAEAQGIGRATVGGVTDHPNGDVRRMLGIDPGLGKALGLDETWARRAILAAGNYGEVFEENLGRPLGLERGPNAPLSKGGIMTTPQFR